MQLFFQEQLTAEDSQVTFNRDESKHITRVLRKNTGDSLHVTNGKGWLFKVQIISDNQNKCKAEIKESTYYKPKGYKLHICIAPTKNNDRLEWFLEKSTEIGVTEITPILCDHSERKVIKPERLERVLQSAMKQSLQFHKPILNALTPLSELLETSFKGQTFIAHCENDKPRRALKSEINSKEITILIGPEGDFSLTEIDSALERNFIPIILGDTRLRTETAGIVAATLVASQLS